MRSSVKEGFGFSADFWASVSRPRATDEPGPPKGNNMSFGLYAIGFVILTIGLIYGAYLLHVPRHWIVVGAIVLIGAGILSGVKATRQRDTAT
jgi:hypothetical protein